MKLIFDINKSKKQLVCLLFLLLFCIELFITSWLSDDACITLRTVLNFINGFGPTFNIDERVQAYTHPLWFILLSIFAFIFNANIFVTALFLNIILSLAALYILLTKFTNDILTITILACCVILSKSFVEFSTSGLENSLTHFLIVILVLASINFNKKMDRINLTFFLCCCSLLYLTRFDVITIVAPLIFAVIYRSINKNIKIWHPILVSIIPIAAWHLFSLYYYGFLWPNTAYAKLGSGVSSPQLLLQGLKYLLISCCYDPLNACVTLFGICLAQKNAKTYTGSLILGIIMYYLYVIVIGGDFMAGRFLTSTFFVSVILLSLSSNSIDFQYVLLFCIISVGLIDINNTLSDSKKNIENFKYNTYANPFLSGIADEKKYYYSRSNLLINQFHALEIPSWRVKQKRTVRVLCGGLGNMGLFSGPSVHCIDTCGLSDPLLARMFANHTSSNWRIGHFVRTLPEGYIESILYNKNEIKDPLIHKKYQALMQITRGPLNDPGRWKTILLFNLGYYS